VQDLIIQFTFFTSVLSCYLMASSSQLHQVLFTQSDRLSTNTCTLAGFVTFRESSSGRLDRTYFPQIEKRVSDVIKKV